VQDVIGKTGSFAKQFVVGGVTQFVEGWQVCWAVSMTSSATYHYQVEMQFTKKKSSTSFGYFNL